MEDNEIEKHEETLTEESAEQSIAELTAELVGEDLLVQLAQKEGLMGSIDSDMEANGLEPGLATESPENQTENQTENQQEAPELSSEEKNNLTASMETILFMSDKPVSLPRLRALLDATVPIGTYRALMTELRADYARDHRGIEIAEVSLGFQLRTKPHMVSVLRKLVKTQPLKLSPATLETLAVVAYKQPVTKDELDQIRGVDSGYVLRNLMEKRLVRISGRSDLPGRPMLYGTTHEFLELFSLRDLKALPALHEVESMVASSEVGEQEQERKSFEDFSKMVAQNTGPLFQDSELDEELEQIKEVISSISTSTPFIEEQKLKEKLLLTGGVLPENLGGDLPVETVIQAISNELSDATPSTVSDALAPTVETPATSSHEPSPELVAQAEADRWERHAAMIAEAISESAKPAEPPAQSPDSNGVSDPENKLVSETETVV